MEVIQLEAGVFRTDGGIMFGACPKSHWSKLYPPNENNMIDLAMRCVLIHTPDSHYILVDAGVGDKHIKDAVGYDWVDTTHILESLKKKGITSEMITDVVLTHLHFDHCGGCTTINKTTGQYELCFPNARYWVSKLQWENFFNPHPLEKESFYLDDMELVQKCNKLELVESSKKLCEGVTLELFNGHTPGQIVVFIYDSKENIIIPGDVIPFFSNIDLFIISAYDITPLESYYAKVSLLKKAFEDGSKLIFYHDCYTSQAKVVRRGENFEGIKI